MTERVGRDGVLARNHFAPVVKADARRRETPVVRIGHGKRARQAPAVATASCRRPLVFDAGNESVERRPEQIAIHVALHHDFVARAVDDDQTAGAQPRRRSARRAGVDHAIRARRR